MYNDDDDGCNKDYDDDYGGAIIKIMMRNLGWVRCTMMTMMVAQCSVTAKRGRGKTC